MNAQPEKQPEKQNENRNAAGSSSPLARAIAARAAELTRKVVAELYVNPFWEDRFGARGRRFSEEDGQYHLSYLGQALSAGTSGDPATLIHYALWLRTVLVSRGMCTLHLVENFARLAATLQKEPIADVERASDFLVQAAAALRYPEGPARQLQDQAPAIADKLARAIAHEHPQWQSPYPHHDSFHAWCQDELLHYLSYLADSVAMARPELLVKYVLWSNDYLARRAAPSAAVSPWMPRVPALVAALAQELSDPGQHALSVVVAPVLIAAAAAVRTS